MATKPTYKAEKPAIRSESKDYIVKRVNGLEEELKRHEKMDLLKACLLYTSPSPRDS